jgi:hypothetical protein
MARTTNAAPAADAAAKPARSKPGVRARKERARKAAATRAANKAAATNGADTTSAPAAPAAKPAAPTMRELGTFAVIEESNERGKIIARAEYLHHGGVAQYLLAYTRADGCYDERWFAAGQLIDWVERRRGARR